jgi:hypothetical protein
VCRLITALLPTIHAQYISRRRQNTTALAKLSDFGERSNGAVLVCLHVNSVSHEVILLF